MIRDVSKISTAAFLLATLVTTGSYAAEQKPVDCGYKNIMEYFSEGTGSSKVQPANTQSFNNGKVTSKKIFFEEES